MSRQTALDNIHLRPTTRWAHTEYSLEYHKPYIQRLTGMDSSHPAAMSRTFDLWGLDFLFCTNDGLHGDWRQRGRATNMGHARYASDGSDFVPAQQSPFNSAEEVWAFDPAAEYGLPDFSAQVAAYEQWHQAMRAQHPDQLVTGGFYKTLISGAIEAFGWEMLLLGASDAHKMEGVFDRLFRFTKFHMDAWAQTSVEVIIQHDDFVWSAGPFMNPRIYREALIPRYAELWEPLHQAGKKVLFCSDGTFTQFMPDLAAAGADGFIFEPTNDWQYMVEHFGQTHCLVGSDVDCRDLSFGSWETVRRTLDRTFSLAARCRGIILAVGNHLPPNIPEPMMDRYIEYLKANWSRR